MSIETKRLARIGLGIAEPYESVPPAGWQRGRRESDTLTVDAIGLVELRQFADSTVDSI